MGIWGKSDNARFGKEIMTFDCWMIPGKEFLLSDRKSFLLGISIKVLGSYFESNLYLT